APPHRRRQHKAANDDEHPQQGSHVAERVHSTCWIEFRLEPLSSPIVPDCGKAVHESCKTCGEADSRFFSSRESSNDRRGGACGRGLRAALRLTPRNVLVRSPLRSCHTTP